MPLATATPAMVTRPPRSVVAGGTSERNAQPRSAPHGPIRSGAGAAAVASTRASAQPQSRKGTSVRTSPRTSRSATAPAGAVAIACGAPEASGAVRPAPNHVAHAVTCPSGMVLSARFCSTTHKP
jgi:hypothetical protein